MNCRFGTGAGHFEEVMDMCRFGIERGDNIQSVWTVPERNIAEVGLRDMLVVGIVPEKDIGIVVVAVRE